MNTLRVARQAVRAAPRTFRAAPAAQRFVQQRRGYADVASDKIQLSLALPHQVRFGSGKEVGLEGRRMRRRRFGRAMG